MPNHPQMSELADEHGMDLHYGREDKPHVHEWRVGALRRAEPLITCWGCTEELSREEAERRLNATERLSAEQAEYTAKFIRLDDDSIVRLWQDKIDGLEAYAAALKGKTP